MITTRPTRSRRPSSARFLPARSRPGFTLVEMLTVLIIITLLIAMTMNVKRAVEYKQNLSKAQSEMGAIDQALQQFKAMYGEYPPMDSQVGSGSPYAEQNLLLALTGRARWTHDSSNNLQWEIVQGGMTHALNDGSVLPGGDRYTWGKPLIDPSRFVIDVDTSSPSGFAEGAVIHDPWWDGLPGHNAYLYRYKMRSDVNASINQRVWQAPIYILVSRGPDQQPENADANFIWQSVNGSAVNSGYLAPNYLDPNTNPMLSDNLLQGAVQN